MQAHKLGSKVGWSVPMLSDHDEVRPESHRRAEHGFNAAWRNPLPKSAGGAVRLAAIVSLSESGDGTFAHETFAWLKCTPEGPDLPGCVANPLVDFVGSVSWLEPPGTVLLGVVTIIGAGRRQHLVQGAEALLAAFRPELPSGPDGEPLEPLGRALPSADDLIRCAHD